MFQRSGPMLSAVLGVLLLRPALAADLEVEPVTDNVYAIVGPLTQRDADNLANNATYGFIVTEAGVVLIDAGGSYKGAQRLHRAIQTVTDKPVEIVINTGGQDQRWLGNGYFKEQGARIVAAAAAVEDQESRVYDQLSTLDRLVGKEGMDGTEPLYADETFDEQHTLTIGGVTLELRNPGVAHTPGDTFVWLPRQKVLFSGDIIYIERLLSVSPVSNSKAWLESFEAIAALEPEHIVPGHGHVTDLKEATADTYDYLMRLREGAAGLLEEGVGLESVSRIDQSGFSYLENYEALKGPNAHAVYRELEWE